MQFLVFSSNHGTLKSLSKNKNKILRNLKEKKKKKRSKTIKNEDIDEDVRYSLYGGKMFCWTLNLKEILNKQILSASFPEASLLREAIQKKRISYGNLP